MNNSDLRMNVAIAIRNAMQPPVVSELDMPEPFRQHYLDIAAAAIRATIEALAAEAAETHDSEPWLPVWLRAHIDPEAGAAT